MTELMNVSSEIIGKVEGANVVRVTMTLDLVPNTAEAQVITSRQALAQWAYDAAAAMVEGDNQEMQDTWGIGHQGFEIAKMSVMTQAIETKLTKEFVESKVKAQSETQIKALQEALTRGDIDAFAFANALTDLRANMAKDLRNGLGSFGLAFVDDEGNIALSTAA